MDKREGEIKLFRRKSFVSQFRKNFVGESFTVALISGIAKVWITGAGSIQSLCRKLFVSQCRKFQYGNPLLH